LRVSDSANQSDSIAQILVVDDNTFNVYSLKLMIEEFFKINCDVAYSGVEGIKMVTQRFEKNQSPYKLILTDINMPEMDGLQMSKKIKKILFKRQKSEYFRRRNT
jgi:CheY-like chemotaxis protein